MSNRSVVCKMKCHSAPAKDEITTNPQTIVMGAVYEPDQGQRELPENAVFGKATPWGEFKAAIANPEAKALLVPGKSYFITITEAPD